MVSGSGERCKDVSDEGYPGSLRPALPWGCICPGPPAAACSQPVACSCLADGEKPDSRDVIPMEALGPGEYRCLFPGEDQGCLRWARRFCHVHACVCVVLGRPSSHEALVGKEIWFRGTQGVRGWGSQGEVSAQLGSLVCQLRGDWRGLSCQWGAGELPQGLSRSRQGMVRAGGRGYEKTCPRHPGWCWGRTGKCSLQMHPALGAPGLSREGALLLWGLPLSIPLVPPQMDTPQWTRGSGGLEAVPLQGTSLRRSL